MAHLQEGEKPLEQPVASLPQHLRLFEVGSHRVGLSKGNRPVISTFLPLHIPTPREKLVCHRFIHFCTILFHFPLTTRIDVKSTRNQQSTPSIWSLHPPLEDWPRHSWWHPTLYLQCVNLQLLPNQPICTSITSLQTLNFSPAFEDHIISRIKRPTQCIFRMAATNKLWSFQIGRRDQSSRALFFHGATRT